MKVYKIGYILIAVLLLFGKGYTRAQEEQNYMPSEKWKLIRKTINWFNAIDTIYISPDKYNLTIMLEESTWFEHYYLRSFNPSLIAKKIFSYFLAV